MTSAESNPRVQVFPPSRQGTGSFDGGKITEIKPIGFPREPSAVPRVGPLFYWAWATAPGPAKIAMHPHQAFEIVSYVLSGRLGHADSLGTRSEVSAGGLQVMQTGSGVSHEEVMLEPETQFFQVWFEPDLRAAVEREPTYLEVPPSRLQANREGDIDVTPLLGAGSPVQLVADVRMWDVRLPAATTWNAELAPGRAWAVVTVEGQGSWEVAGDPTRFGPRDFSLVSATDGTVPVSLRADGRTHAVFVEVPLSVDYPLYPK